MRGLDQQLMTCGWAGLAHWRLKLRDPSSTEAGWAGWAELTGGDWGSGARGGQLWRGHHGR